ncbi:MAG: nucleotidyltransferase family protein [Trueperaceae bacterium]|nr:nucleotidyltransferase family protein [Trueperaceae bacterium]
MPERIAAIVLAAGESRRMGRPKLLLQHAGETLLARALRITAPVTSSTTVVVGAYAERYTPEARRLGAAVVYNPDWPQGMASSLVVGLDALSAEVSATLIVLPDQPFVTTDHLQNLLDTHHATGTPLVVSRYADSDVTGAPVLLHRSLFDAARRLSGDRGAKHLARHAPTAEVVLDNPKDIDTPADVAQLDVSKSSLD